MGGPTYSLETWIEKDCGEKEEATWPRHSLCPFSLVSSAPAEISLLAGFRDLLCYTFKPDLDPGEFVILVSSSVAGVQSERGTG